jgi:hypothetical protein
MKVIICIVAGLVAPLLWTALESLLIAALPSASSYLMWRGVQVFVALVSVLVLVLPFVLVLRPSSPRLGFVFVGSFVASEVVYQVVLRGAPDDLLGLFQLPDTWVFLVTSLGLFFWVSSRNAVRHAA